MAQLIADVTDNYYHVRYNDPDTFDEIRTPDWAENPASSVAEGAEVRTGHRAGGDDSDWEIRSVLIPTDEASEEDDALDKTEHIVEKIER